MYTRQQKYGNNNNRQREKRGGGDRVNCHLIICMYVCMFEKIFSAKVRAMRNIVLQKLQNG